MGTWQAIEALTIELLNTRTVRALILLAAAAAAVFYSTGCALELEPAGADVSEPGEPSDAPTFEPTDDAGDLEQESTAGGDDAGGELEPDAPELGELEPDAADDEPPAELFPWLFTQPAARCDGHWAGDDVSTRLTSHPDTGLCTFACTWEDPRCDEPWYADERCTAYGAARLGMLCGELGGSCEWDSHRVNRYCVVLP